ncbi:hypothetical protein F5887DRAFT_923750 [Amanita rubescens]|nr:hypothetical protein F5887DRAFT_923750 [Amanita rubescens]
MAKRKSRGNNRGGQGSGGGFNGGRGRGAPPVDFDILDFPVQVYGYQPMTPTGREAEIEGEVIEAREALPLFQGQVPLREGTLLSSPGHLLRPERDGKRRIRPSWAWTTGSAADEVKVRICRPLLRPVFFVKSTLTPFLFQQEEELLKPTMEDIDDAEDNRIPTANRIAQVIGGLDLENEEEIEEIDFNDTEKLLEVQAKPGKMFTVALEEQFTGYYHGTAAPLGRDQQVAHPNEDRSNEQSSVNVVEGIADITLNSQPDFTGSDLPRESAGVTQETESIVMRPEGAVSQGRTIRDEAELAPIKNVSTHMKMSTSHLATAEGEGEQQCPESAGFFIDTTPSQILAPSQLRKGTAASHILGAPEALGDDDDIIVYVAPHPRSGRLTPAVSTSNIPTTLPTTSMLTGLSTISELPSTNAEEKMETNIPIPSTSTTLSAAARKPRQFVSPLLLASPSTQRKAKVRVRMQESRHARQKKWRKRSMFSFGAERQDKEWQELDGPDPRWEERRRGDSDIDWGEEENEQGAAAGEPLTGPDGMDVDPELLDEKSIGALGSFANGMLGQEGTRYLTMDDIADIEKLKQEDEASEGGAKGSSGDDDSEGEEVDEQTSGEDDKDVDGVFEKEEEMLIGEDAQQSDVDEGSEEEDELSSCSSFRERLELIRKLPAKSQLIRRDSWVKMKRAKLNLTQDLVDETEGILTGCDRKERKRLFKAINNGDREDLSTFTVARRKKDKPTNLPPELQEQWVKDRAKKAEKKAERERARLEAAADPLIKKKGGKKGRKAMLAAARQDPKITVIGPNRVIDMTTLVQQIKRFIANPDGPRTMALPPASKETRKFVHEMAAAFNLKSKSDGHGDARYTVLIRTSRSGLRVNEAKVARIMRQSHGGEFNKSDRKGKGKSGPPRQKEGEEVGKAAPKIDSSNRGFRLLEAMGWSEGKQIGITGGLDQPLTAIIKHSKLGLGATRWMQE